jgi:hypothetical protein
MDRWFHFQAGANGIARPALRVSLFSVIAFKYCDGCGDHSPHQHSLLPPV